MNQPVVVDEAECHWERRPGAGGTGVRWRTLLCRDRTDSEALPLGIAELPPDQRGSPGLHHHAQPEAYYILSGEGVVVVDDVEHPVRAGVTVFIPGGSRHAARNTGHGTLRLLYVFATDSFGDVEYHYDDED